jgi:hypothetical protein
VGQVQLFGFIFDVEAAYSDVEYKLKMDDGAATLSFAQPSLVSPYSAHPDDPPDTAGVVIMTSLTKAGDTVLSRYFRFPNGVDRIRDALVLRVQASPDVIDATWATPLVSLDNSSSWNTQRNIQIVMPGATIRQTNGSILSLPYYYNFSTPRVTVWNATTIHGSAQIIDVVAGKLVVCSAPTITISGFPHPLRPSGEWTDVPDESGPCPVADLNPTDVVATRDGSGLLGIMQNVLWANTTVLAKDPTDFPSSVVVIKSSNGGYDWTYHATVPGSRDEATWTRLPDGRILLVLRDDGPTPQCNWTGGRRSSGVLRAFCCAYSADEGLTWENTTMMRARGDGVPPHSVLPQLRWTKSGVLLLSGGRSGIFLWACASVECIESGGWQVINLGLYHNSQLEPYDNPPHASKAICAKQHGSGWGCAPRFPVSVTDPAKWDSMDNPVYGATTGYLSLEVFGEDKFVVCYDVDCSGCPNSTEVYCQTGRARAPNKPNSQALKSDDSTHLKRYEIARLVELAREFGHGTPALTSDKSMRYSHIDENSRESIWPNVTKVSIPLMTVSYHISVCLFSYFSLLGSVQTSATDRDRNGDGTQHLHVWADSWPGSANWSSANYANQRLAWRVTSEVSPCSMRSTLWRRTGCSLSVR